MTPPKKADNTAHNAPQWLINSFKADGYKFDDKGNITSNPPAKKPAGTGNGVQYNAAQGLKGVTARKTTAAPFDTSDIPGFGGLKIYNNPTLKGPANVIPGSVHTGGIVPMGHGLGVVTGTHKPHAPVVRFEGGSHSGSAPSRLAGPGAKTPTVHVPSFNMAPSGVVGGDRTYGMVPNK